MTSIDYRDAEVQQLFTSMKKAHLQSEKIEIGESLATMYEKNDEYSDGIFTRIYKFISQSNEKQDKRVGLIVLSKVGLKMQGIARSVFVSKFHSPVFKLFETNLDQGLLSRIQQAYQVILQTGGNRNDSTVESNLNTVISLLDSNLKDIKKICAYSVIRILVKKSPYITFKKLLQKQKDSHDNLSILTNTGKHKNIKVRIAYIKFLDEYIKYIAEKKDISFQKATFTRLLDFDNPPKDLNEQNNYIYIQTAIILLQRLFHLFTGTQMSQLLTYTIYKINLNKNSVIQKCLIKMIPLLKDNTKPDVFIKFFGYLKMIGGEDRVIAQKGINQLLSNYALYRTKYINQLQQTITQISNQFKNILTGSVANISSEMVAQEVKTIQIILMNLEQQLISKPQLDNLLSYCIVLAINDESLKLVQQISKKNVYQLSQVLEKKIIILISKVLSGNSRIVIRQAADVGDFYDLLEKASASYHYLESQQNQIKAVEALSFYRFQPQFRDTIAAFLKEKVLKYNLAWGVAQMRSASVSAAFFLYAKKGQYVATTQMIQILGKLLRVGINDPDEGVRQKVFNSILKNIKRSDGFQQFFLNNELINQIFQSINDHNEKISLLVLEILCVMHQNSYFGNLTTFLKNVAYNMLYNFTAKFKYSNERKKLIKSITILIEFAPSIIQNHVYSLLDILLDYLDDTNKYEGLQINFFEMVSALAVSIPDTLIPYAKQLSAYLLYAMNDKLNTQKRNLAMSTFIKIIKECGYVLLPYCELNGFLDTLVQLMRSEIGTDSRDNLMKILGALGTIDKYRHQRIIQIQNQKQYGLLKLTSKFNFLKRRTALQNCTHQNVLAKEVKLYHNELLLLNSGASHQRSLVSKHRMQNQQIKQQQQKGTQLSSLETDSMVDFTLIILKHLLLILGDQSLSQKHQLGQDVLEQILNIMGSQIQPYLNVILPHLLQLAQQNEQLFNIIISLSQQCDLGFFISDILTFAISKCKSIDVMINVVLIISFRYYSFLRRHIESIIEKMYSIIQSHFLQQKLMVKIVQIYQNLQQLVEPYIPIILPQLLEKFMSNSSQVTATVIDWLIIASKNCLSLVQHLSQISNKFAHLLKLCHNKHRDCRPCMRVRICNCIVLMLVVYKQSFIHYLPLIHASVIVCDDVHPLYQKALRYLDLCVDGCFLSILSPDEQERLTTQPRNPFLTRFEMPKYARSVQGAEELIQQFDPASKKLVEQDWVEWLKKISLLLLKKSPNNLLRACCDLAEEYTQLSFQLFNVAFYYFWQILVDEQKKILIQNIQKILTYNPKPYLLVRKTILQMTQFMHRKKCSFHLGNDLLAECARDASAFTKHLYYREIQFQLHPQKSIQPLIEVLMKLGHHENAFGLLKVCVNMGIACDTDWYEKLNRYQDAYMAYDRFDTQEYALKKLKCLSHFNYESFLDEVEKNKNLILDGELAVLVTKSYAQLEEWDKVEEWYEKIQNDNEDKKFWEAIVSIKHNQYDHAISCINFSRDNIYEEISELITFSTSSQSFQKLLRLQQLFELEEIIEINSLKNKLLSRHKNSKIECQKHIHNRSQRIKEIWSDRLIGCSRNQKLWGNLAFVRSLLFTKLEYFQFWYQYCEILIEEMRIEKCQRIMKMLRMEAKESEPNVINKLKILQIKIQFAQSLIIVPQDVQRVVNFLQPIQNIDHSLIGALIYQCANTLLQISKNKQSKLQAINLVTKACQLCNTQKQWHLLGQLHLEIAQQISNNGQEMEYHIVCSIESLIKSLKIQESEDYLLEGSLKLLGILKNYSHLNKVDLTIQKQFDSIPINAWINIVPQMIAQLDHSNQHRQFSSILKHILTNIGLNYPQALLYPLNFAVKSKITQRVQPAKEILLIISNKHPTLTEQALKISSELGKAAFKLKEYWYDTIESAWNLFQHKNVREVLTLLKQLYKQVKSRKQSNSQLAFYEQFGLEIEEGYQWLLRYEKENSDACLFQAFDIFYNIYKKIKDSLENLRKVYLKNVAPALVSSKTYQSSIPGLYRPTKPLIRIDSFNNELTVLISKQRPRKLTIFGTDGKEYNFLLKGREDLRLDERVMQFFGLVNRLLDEEKERFRKQLDIARYSIIPLTVNTGLIGWVENCDTLNELIKQYRTSNKIRTYVEKQLYENICFEYANLPMINKLQIFKTGLEKTQGKDLLKILWLKSKSSEIWIEKRTNYTTSLAVMSMVGYILGLGDRHPSNIMIHRQTGKVVHIDFGDCFQVASLRDKFPQKVPFRLTRMLQKAMGVSGIHGLYQETCEVVMKVLRSNKDNLLSVLETFAHDPILSWRIIVNEEEKSSKKVLEVQIQVENMEEKVPKIKMSYQVYHNHINEKALKVLERIKLKLQGKEFYSNKTLSVTQQVNKLIREAISHENICQSWPGWCPFW